MRTWEKVFLIAWAIGMIQAPVVIGVIDIGGHLGWWRV